MSADEPAAPPAPQGGGKLRKKTAQSAAWLILRFGLRQGAVTLAFFVIAAITSPEAFGLASIALAFGLFARVAVIRGFRDVIIQRPELDALATATAAWINIGLGTLLGLLIIGVTPLITRLYGSDALFWPIIVSALIPIQSAFSAIQEALLERAFRHRVLTVAQAIASLVAAPFSVFLAMAGADIWAPIALTVIDLALFSVIVFAIGRYLPGLRFNVSEARTQIAFAWPLILSSVFNGGYLRVSQLLVGAWLGAEEVAFFRIGLQANQTLMQIINAPIAQALFAGVARLKKGHGEVYLRALSVFSALTFPIYLGVGAISPLLIPLALGQEWAPAGMLSAILCLAIFGNLFPQILRPVLIVLNASRAELLNVSLSALFGMAMIAVGAQISLEAAAYGYLMKMLLSIPLSMFLARRYAGASLTAQILAVAGYAILSVLMFLGVLWLIDALAGSVSAWLALAIAISAGAVFYLVAVWSIVRYAIPRSYEPLIDFTPGRLRWLHLPPLPSSRQSSERHVE